MASKKKKSAKTYKVLVLDNGREYELVGETGKYWLCKGTQFRKSAHRDAVVETRKIEQPDEPKAEE